MDNATTDFREQRITYHGGDGQLFPGLRVLWQRGVWRQLQELWHEPLLPARQRHQARKLHGVAQPWVWLYPNKDACNALDLPDIPSFAPQAWGDYCKAIAPYVMGIFTESECDRFLNN